jgi:hypothetical protein
LPRVHRFGTFAAAVAPLQFLVEETHTERAHRVTRGVTEYFRVGPATLLRHLIDPGVLPSVLLRDHVEPLFDLDTTSLSVAECIDMNFDN